MDIVKKYLLFFFLLVWNQNVFSQGNGYKDLNIGTYLFGQKIIHTYKFKIHNSDKSLFRLESILPQYICDEKVDYLDIKISSDSTIELIQLYTEEINIKDVDDYFKRYETITGCIVSTIGKADYYQNGNDQKDGHMSMAWVSPEKNILALHTYSPSVWDKNVKRLYQFVWFKSAEEKKMW